MNTRNNSRTIVAASERITKKQIDETLAAGNTHARFTSRKVNKRLIKNKEKILRAQEVRENKLKRENKQFDDFRKRQLLDDASKKFDSFEKEVSALQDNTIETAPLGETFAVSGIAPQTGEYVDTLGIVTQEPIYNHETGDFEVPEPAKEPAKLTEALQMPVLESNQVLVNLYGDAVTYKPFPEINDPIRPDGLVMVMHTCDNGHVPTGQELVDLKEVNYIFDKLVYRSPDEDVEDPVKPSVNFEVALTDTPVTTEDGVLINAAQDTTFSLPS